MFNPLLEKKVKLLKVWTQEQTSGNNLRQDYLSACHLPGLSNSVLLSGKSGNSNNPVCTERDDTLINMGI